jgi:hypothetical protein
MVFLFELSILIHTPIVYRLADISSGDIAVSDSGPEEVVVTQGLDEVGTLQGYNTIFYTRLSEFRHNDID